MKYILLALTVLMVTACSTTFSEVAVGDITLQLPEWNDAAQTDETVLKSVAQAGCGVGVKKDESPKAVVSGAISDHIERNGGTTSMSGDVMTSTQNIGGTEIKAKTTFIECAGATYSVQAFCTSNKYDKQSAFVETVINSVSC